nr:ubiquitin-specific protease 13 [Tanacetum cinerariifolium]
MSCLRLSTQRLLREKVQRLLESLRSKKNKQVSDSSSSFEDEKPIKKKKKPDAKNKKKKPLTLAQIKKEMYLSGFLVLHFRTVPCSLFFAIRDSLVDIKSFLSDIKKKRSKKKSKKPLTAEQIKKIEYLDDLLGLRSRTVPSSLFVAIRDSQVDMESFLSDIRFSLLHNVYIDTLPRRFARFVVRAFGASSYEFKLKKGIIHVTPEKVHEILGVPLGGTSIFDLPKIPLDDPFVKEWFKQFDPKPLKKIRACDI